MISVIEIVETKEAILAGHVESHNNYKLRILSERGKSLTLNTTPPVKIPPS